VANNYFYVHNGLTAGALSIDAATGKLTTLGIITSTSTQVANNTFSGALVITGGAGIGGKLYVGEDIYSKTSLVLTTSSVKSYVVTSLGSGTGTAVSTSTGDVIVWSTASLQTVTGFGNSTDIAIKITNSTSATSTSTGSLVVAGGVGIGGTLWVGDDVYSKGNLVLTTASIKTYGVSKITPGTGTAVSSSTGEVTIWSTATLQDVTSQGSSTDRSISITSSTSSTDTSSGALKVTGGVGIGGNLNVGGQLKVNNEATFLGNVTFSGNATYVYSTNTLYTDNILELHTPSDGQWTLDDGKSIGLKFHYFNNATNTNAALVLKNDSKFLEWFSFGVTGDSTFTSATYGTFKTGSIRLVDSTTATSTVSGALQVIGGAGIGGTLYVGGDIYSSGSRVVTETNLGTYGISAIYAGTGTAVSSTTGSVTIWSTATLQDVTSQGSSTDRSISISSSTNSTSTNAGALRVTGGVGVGRNLYVGGQLVVTNSTVSTVSDGSLLTINHPGNKNWAVLIGDAVNTGSTTGIYLRSTTTSYIAWGAQGSLVFTSSGVGIERMRIDSSGSLVIATTTSAINSQSGALQVAGGVGIGGDLYVGGNIYGKISGTVTATTHIVGGAANRIVYNTGTDTTSFIIAPPASNVFLQYTGNNAFTWTSFSAGTDTAISVTGADVKIWNNSTLQSITNRGNSTSNAISITSSTASTSTTTGALTVLGGVGIQGDLYVGKTIYGTITGSITTASNVAAGSANRILYQTSTGTTGFITTPTNFGTFLQYSTTNTFVWTTVTAGVSKITPGTGTAVSSSTGDITIWSTASLQTVTAIGNSTDIAIKITNSTSATSTSTGSLVVTGGVGIGGDLYVGGTIYGKVSVTGVVDSATTATNLAGGAPGSIPYQTNTGTTSFVSVTTSGWLLQSNGSSAPSYVNPTSLTVSKAGDITDGAANQILYQQTADQTSFIDAPADANTFLLFRGGSFVWSSTINNTAQSTSTNSGAFQVVGGVGIGGNLYVGGNIVATNAQISGSIDSATTATHLANGSTGSIPYQTNVGRTGFIPIGTTGTVLVSDGSTATWKASSAISASTASTATNLARGVRGSIPYQTNTGTTDFIPIGTTGTVLVSDGTTATWKAQSTLSVGTATTATHLVGGALGSIPYQTNTGTTGFIPIGSQGQILVVGPNNTASWSTASTSLSVSSATTATNLARGVRGSIPYQTNTGTTDFIPIGSTSSLLVSDGTTATWKPPTAISVNTATYANNISNNQYNSGLQLAYNSDSVTTKFASAPTTTGTFLKYNGDSAYPFTWDTVSQGGVTSVNPGTGTAVSSTTGNVTIWSTATLQNVTDRGRTSTNAISITSTTQSTGTTTGALTVSGGVGIGGNIYTAGEIHITSATASVFYMKYNPTAGAVDFIFG